MVVMRLLLKMIENVFQMDFAIVALESLASRDKILINTNLWFTLSQTSVRLSHNQRFIKL